MEIVFVAALFWQLNLAEAGARHEARVKDIYKHIKTVSQTLYKIHELMNEWELNLNQSASYEKKLKSQYSILFENLDYLKKQSLEKQEERHLLGLLDSRARLLFYEYEKGMRNAAAASPEKQGEVLLAFTENMRGQKYGVQKLAIEFLRTKQESLQSLPQTQLLFRKNLEQIVLSGLAANIIIALFLALFFLKDISSKLALVLDNSMRLRTFSVLNKPLEGKDEICLLDRSFHSMAEQLLAHEELRRSYISLFRDDLQTPLSDVCKNISGLAQGEFGELTTEAKKMLDSAMKNLNRLRNIVDSLAQAGSSLAAPEMKLEIKQVQLQELFDISVDSVSEFARVHGVKLESSCQKSSSFFADQDKLVQVIVNLLSNACKFSPRGESVKLNGRLEDGFLLVEVLDNGRGVPEEKQKSIFDKFQQAELGDAKRGSGTGLGLNICKQIIESHGGRIGVEKRSEKGSRFWFKIPEAQQEKSLNASMPLKETEAK